MSFPLLGALTPPQVAMLALAGFAVMFFLGLSVDEIRQQVQPIVHTEIVSLAGTVRESGKETDQLSFANQLRAALEKPLDTFGLQLVNVGQMMSVRRDHERQ